MMQDIWNSNIDFSQLTLSRKPFPLFLSVAENEKYRYFIYLIHVVSSHLTSLSLFLSFASQGDQADQEPNSHCSFLVLFFVFFFWSLHFLERTFQPEITFPHHQFISYLYLLLGALYWAFLLDQVKNPPPYSSLLNKRCHFSQILTFLPTSQELQATFLGFSKTQIPIKYFEDYFNCISERYIVFSCFVF